MGLSWMTVEELRSTDSAEVFVTHIPYAAFCQLTQLELLDGRRSSGEDASVKTKMEIEVSLGSMKIYFTEVVSVIKLNYSEVDGIYGAGKITAWTPN
jgi:hypothetical protein